jgi:hypothetical protein
VVPLSEGRLRLLRSVEEDDWRHQVVIWARRDGWLIYFTWMSRHSPSGFPDLVLVRPPRVIFAELKTETGTMMPRQDMWGEQLLQCPGVEYYVWRPHDEDEVKQVLAA